MSYHDPNITYDYLDPAYTEEPEEAYQVNKDLSLAYRIMNETSANLFLTGKAGTGKTTFLRHLRQTSAKRMIVLAPTGVAAINAEGSTIHSFFQLPFSPFIPGKGFVGNESKSFSFSKEKRRIIASLDLLVIDEISMVRPDTLDAIDSVLRRFRNPAMPFGGVQLLLIGDLRQLAPVLRDNERELLSPYYPSEYFFDSTALKQSGFVTIELSTVYRQNDPDFINILNAVREGLLTQELLSRLNSRYLAGFNPPDSEKYIRLTTHNRMADEVNSRRLALLQGESATYNAIIKGNFPTSSYPAESMLTLKVGAQVMFIKNDTGLDRQYYNGMIGEVTGLNKDNVIVRPADGRKPITVNFVEWENSKYVIDEQSKEITQITEGTFAQLPLRLAWAITIHKSQGLTFDKAIIDAGDSFAPGQTYVALSRCRSLEGMVLSRPVPVSAVITDRTVNDFIDFSKQNRPDDDDVDRMRAEYTRHSLSEVFDFRDLRLSFDDFHRAVKEYVMPIYPDYYDSFRQAAEIMNNKIDIPGAKFKALYAASPISPEDLEQHPEFLEKIKNGCKYFLDLIKEVMATTDSVNVKLDNAAYVKRLTNAYESVSFKLNVKYHLLRYLSLVSFSPAEYINAKAKAVLDSTKQNESKKRSEKQKKQHPLGKLQEREEAKIKKTEEPVTATFSKEKAVKKEKKPVGYSKRISFDMYNSGKSIQEIAAERGLAPSTVAGHLGEFVASGELDILNTMSAETLAKIKEAFKGVETYAQAREKLDEGEVSNHELSIYYRGIYKPSIPPTQK